MTAREQNVKNEFQRNPNYWDKASKGNVDKLTLAVIKEDATRVAALLSGGVDMIAPVSANDYQRIKDAEGVDLHYPRHSCDYLPNEPKQQPSVDRCASASSDCLRHQQ